MALTEAELESQTADLVLGQLRDQITELDRSIVAAVNKRLKLVQQIRRYKESRGLPLVDQGREQWMLAYQRRANRGPLSDEGLQQLHALLLDLTKREVFRD